MNNFIALVQNLIATLTDVDFNDIVIELSHKDGNTYYMIPWQFSHYFDIDEINESLPSSEYAKYAPPTKDSFAQAKELEEQGFEYKPTIFINEKTQNALESLKNWKKK